MMALMTLLRLRNAFPTFCVVAEQKENLAKISFFYDETRRGRIFRHLTSASFVYKSCRSLPPLHEKGGRRAALEPRLRKDTMAHDTAAV